MEYLAAYRSFYNLPATVARIIPYQIPLVLVLIYMLLRTGKYKQGGLLPACHLLSHYLFYRQRLKIPQFSSFPGKNPRQEGKHLLLFCQSDYDNVPAALLFLSGFLQIITGLNCRNQYWSLGTLIASMASLISFKYIAKENRI